MGYEYLRALFEPDQEGGEPKRLGYDDLVAAIESHTELRLVNIRDGGYVSKEKYERLSADVTKYKTELAATTERLNQGISKAEEAVDIEALKSAHKAEIEALKAEVDRSNKAVLVRDYLEMEKFTSRFAKTYLAKEMAQNPDVLVIEGQLVGAEDALKLYKKEYADAFASEEPAPPPEPAPVTAPASKLPYFTPTTVSIKETPQPVPYRFK